MAYFKELIVKFNEGNKLREKNGQLVSDMEYMGKFLAIIDQIPGARVRQSYPRLSDRLRRMRRSRRPEIPTLELFVRVHLRKKPTNLDELLRDLKALADVEFASVALRPSSTPPSPDPPDYEGQQSHLGSPGGVNARAGWNIPGGDGCGDRIRICDCEWSFFDHDDLPDISLPTAELPTDMHERHGTKVLGVLAAVSNSFGVTGVAPGAALSFVSVYNPDPDPDPETLGDPIETYGIDTASGDPPDEKPDFRNLRTDAGDVLLVELTLRANNVDLDLPADGNEDTWNAIHRVSDTLGVTVVLPAGNRGISLDTDPAAENNRHKRIWEDGHAHYRDSLAVIVGAGRASGAVQDVGTPHSKIDNVSNWGERVDCQGWGEHIYTTGGGKPPPSDEPNERRRYTGDFGQTSGAAAMIAGVVACLQGAAKASTGSPLTPELVRKMFRDDNDEYGGTPQGDASGNRIGPLPNLVALIQAIPSG